MDPSQLEYSRNLIKKLQRYEIELQVAKRQADVAIRDRDEKVREARERAEAMRSVLAALVGSLRIYGLDKKKFTRAVRDAARDTPASGPQAVRHAVLFEETNLILGLHGAGNR